jgi:flagellar motor switch protein FliN/FliY
MSGETPQAKPDASLSPEMAAVQALDAASQAAATLSSETGANVKPVDLPDFAALGGAVSTSQSSLGLLDDVTLNVKIELGRTRMYVEDVLRLNENSVVELDKAAGDPVDIYVNDRHVARGEVLVLNENFCVRVSEIIQPVGVEE